MYMYKNEYTNQILVISRKFILRQIFVSYIYNCLLLAIKSYLHINERGGLVYFYRKN